MKLKVDPLSQPHVLYGLDVAGPRAEGQAIESMQNLLIAAEHFFKLL